MATPVVGVVVGKAVDLVIDYVLESKGGLLDELEDRYPVEIGLSGTLQGIPYEPLAYDPVYHESWGWRYFEQGLIKSQPEWFEAACAAFERAFDQSSAVESQINRLCWQALARTEAARQWEAERQRGAFQYAHTLMERAHELAAEIPGEDPDGKTLAYTHRLHGFVYHRQGGKREIDKAFHEYRKANYESPRLNRHKRRAGAGKRLPSNSPSGILPKISDRLARIPTYVSISIVLSTLAILAAADLSKVLRILPQVSFPPATSDDWWQVLGMVAVIALAVAILVVVLAAFWRAVKRRAISQGSRRWGISDLEHGLPGRPSLPSSRVRDEIGVPSTSERD